MLASQIRTRVHQVSGPSLLDILVKVRLHGALLLELIIVRSMVSRHLVSGDVS